MIWFLPLIISLPLCKCNRILNTFDSSSTYNPIKMKSSGSNTIRLQIVNIIPYSCWVARKLQAGWYFIFDLSIWKTFHREFGGNFFSNSSITFRVCPHNRVEPNIFLNYFTDNYQNLHCFYDYYSIVLLLSFHCSSTVWVFPSKCIMFALHIIICNVYII